MSKTYLDPETDNNPVKYEVERPDGGWRRVFDDEDKRKLRPIAETLAMLDGNAFFGLGGHPDTHYEAYLPEADAIYRSNGGDDGWACECSWLREQREIQEDPTLQDLYDKLQVLLELKRKTNGII
jgi:hypothetical protein